MRYNAVRCFGISRMNKTFDSFQEAIRFIGEESSCNPDHPDRWVIIEIPYNEPDDYDGVVVAELKIGRLR
jgi:hypothetical protein